MTVLAQTSIHRKYQESDALAARITELYAYITAASHKFLMLVAEFDEQGYWQLGGVHSCAHWLNWQCGIGINAAREKVRVARSLTGLPKISKAFARGEISYSKVRAITRAATPETEDYLLMFARHGTAHHVEKLVRGYKRVKRNRDADENGPSGLHPELTTRWDEDGCLVVKARLPAERGALLLKALELAVDRQFDAEQKAKDANAEAEQVCPEGTPSAELETSGQTSTAEKKSVAARRADALAELAEGYLENEAPRGSSADRYQVVVHVDASDSRYAVGESGTTMPKIDNGPHVTAETSRRIGCDASIVPIFKGIKGEVLSVGRKTRAIPPSILRALWTRDGGCRFPGCTNSRFADGHHIRHWADGGETSLKNLVLLCRQHHGLVHEGGFGCEVNRQGSVIFKSPRGNVIPDAFVMPVTKSAKDPAIWIRNDLKSDHIDSRTCVTRWQGETCDWPLAIGHLFAGVTQPVARLQNTRISRRSCDNPP